MCMILVIDTRIMFDSYQRMFDLIKLLPQIFPKCFFPIWLITMAMLMIYADIYKTLSVMLSLMLYDEHANICNWFHDVT